MSLNEIVRSSNSRASTIHIRSAVYPLLWLSMVVPAPSWASAYLLRDTPVLSGVLIFLGAVPSLGMMIAYFVLMFKDPDRLQSIEIVPDNGNAPRCRSRGARFATFRFFGEIGERTAGENGT